MNQTQPEAKSFRRILGIETSTKMQSFALLDGDELLDHQQRKVRFNHGSTLLANLDYLLGEHRLTLENIDLFAIGLGPGSFTGLRVGMAIAKALARSVNKPIVGVSSLAALAYPYALTYPKATVFSALDAKRNEIYCGAYSWSNGHYNVISNDSTIGPDDLSQKLVHTAAQNPTIIVGDAMNSYSQLQATKSSSVIIPPRWTASPSALAIASLGRHQALLSGSNDLVTLEPNYIRPSDAEINLKNKQLKPA